MVFVTELIPAHRGSAVLLQRPAGRATETDFSLFAPPLSLTGSLRSVITGRRLFALRRPPTVLYYSNGDGRDSEVTALEIGRGVWEASGCRQRVPLTADPRLDPPLFDLQAIAEHRPDLPSLMADWLAGRAAWLTPDDCPACYSRRLEDFVLACFQCGGVHLAVGSAEAIKVAQLRWATKRRDSPLNWWPAPSAGIVLFETKGDICGRVYQTDLTFHEGG